jgi:pyruvate dehydrogenase E1 component alpha subunit
MFSYHGLIGENIPLGTGYALATRRSSLVYFGDAAAEEDYALTSFGFAATHKLPVLYVCEDNNLSICTPVAERRRWEVCDVAESMGLATAQIDDEPEQICATVRDLLTRLPAYIRIRTCRHMWHAGVGLDGPPERDRLEEFRVRVPQAEQIEEQVTHYVEQLWQEPLQKQ